MANHEERARALLAEFDKASKLPLMARAMKAEALGREAAELLVVFGSKLDSIDALQHATTELIEMLTRAVKC